MSKQKSLRQSIAGAWATLIVILTRAALRVWHLALRALAAMQHVPARLLAVPSLPVELSYVEVVRWLIENRVEAADGGAALRRRCRGGVEVVVFFLDADHQPLPLEQGRTMVAFRAARLDPELDTAFGGHSLVVFHRTARRIRAWPRPTECP